jgi:hypothetical protein
MKIFRTLAEKCFLLLRLKVMWVSIFLIIFIFLTVERESHTEIKVSKCLRETLNIYFLIFSSFPSFTHKSLSFSLKCAFYCVWHIVVRSSWWFTQFIQIYFVFFFVLSLKVASTDF